MSSIKHFEKSLPRKRAAKRKEADNDQAALPRGSASPDLKYMNPVFSNRAYIRNEDFDYICLPPNSSPVEGEILVGYPDWNTERTKPTKDSDPLPARPVKKSLYRPLDFDTYEIRLLRVRKDGRESPIRCSLKYASLINPPEYTALSYRWGDASRFTGCVNIEGWGDIEVTNSLERALRALRHVYHFNHLAE